jgi:hypothetical protein
MDLRIGTSSLLLELISFARSVQHMTLSSPICLAQKTIEWIAHSMAAGTAVEDTTVDKVAVYRTSDGRRIRRTRSTRLVFKESLERRREWTSRMRYILSSE